MDQLVVVSYTWGMKPDLDYTKKLLDVFEGFKTPTYDVDDIRAAGIDIDDPAFFFHFCLLEDRGLLSGADPEHPTLYKYIDRGRELFWTRAPMRLTAQGHDFAAALRTPTVLETIKSKAGEATFQVWVQAAASLASAYFLQKLGLSP